MRPILYLHGFASSPSSRKARLFGEHFSQAGLPVTVPDLSEGRFHDLTLSGQLRVIEHSAQGGPVDLIGSSMGGYLAALYAARHPEVRRVVLMAPAFGFARRWAAELGEPRMELWRTTGSLEVFHYATSRPEPLGWGLMQDALQYEDEPRVEQPVQVWHGVRDAVVPIEASRSFAMNNPSARLIEVDSDHELADVAAHIAGEALAFLRA